MIAKRINCLLILVVLCACNNSTQKAIMPESLTTQTRQDSLSKLYKISVTEAKTSTQDLPLKNIGLQMPNGQVLFLKQDHNAMEIAKSDFEKHGIPENAMFAVKSFFAGAGAYCYGVLEKLTLTIFNTYFDEEGSRSEVEKTKQFKLKNKQWIEVALPPIETSKDFRNKNWQPKKGKYYFSKQFTYTYFNEQYPKGDTRHAGEFSFYIDEVSGTILLNRYESFEDEMIKYILVRPAQDYIVAYALEHQNHKVDTLAMDAYYKHYPLQYKTEAEAEFKQHYQPQSQDETSYGNNFKYCTQTLEAKRHNVIFMQSNTQSEIALANINFDATNLYLLAKSEAMPETGLKIPLHQQNLPGNLLLVADESVINEKRIGFKLTCISETSYFIDLDTMP